MNPNLLAKLGCYMKCNDKILSISKHALQDWELSWAPPWTWRTCGSFQQYQWCDEPYHVDRYMKSIQLDVPTFDGRLNYSDRSGPKEFLNWLQSIDRYFTRHLLSEAGIVSFATIELTGQVSRYWSALETSPWVKRRIPYWNLAWHEGSFESKVSLYPWNYWDKKLTLWFNTLMFPI